MATVFLVLVVVLVVAGLVFGVVSLLSGDDPGMSAVEPDGRARPLPNNRSLSEFDLKDVRFDTGLRGYRMSQVDRVLRRTAYDLGYKDEMIAVLEAEVIALREGRVEDAELLRKARESAAGPPPAAPAQPDLVLPTDDRGFESTEFESTEFESTESDYEPTHGVEDFARTAETSKDRSGTAEAAEAEAEPATIDEPPAPDLPREGSLRRREETPVDDAVDTTDTMREPPESAVPPETAVPPEGDVPPDASAPPEGTVAEEAARDLPAAGAAGETTAADPVDRSAHA